MKVVNSQSIFSIDLNRDSTRDINFRWDNASFHLYGYSNFFVHPLHSNVKVHVIQSTQPICRDSFFYNNAYWIYKLHSCTGGSSQIRIDTFLATPNLSRDALAGTQINQLPGDTFLVHKSWSSTRYDPLAPSEYYSYGFFTNSNSGYMLFSVNSKRYALLLRLQRGYLYFDELLNLD